MTRSLRVAIVNEVYAPDLPSPDALLDRFTTLTGWAEAAAANGAAVAVCQRFAFDAERQRGGVEYFFVGDSGPPRSSVLRAASAALHAAAIRWAPDVVHVNGLDHPRSLRRLRRRSAARLTPVTGGRRPPAIVVQDHGGFDPRHLPSWRRMWMRYGLRAATAVLVATPPQIELFRSSGLVPDRLPILDVPEGSTTLRVRERLCSTGNPALLWVGRLNEIKDPLTVLAGFAKFVALRPDATLTYIYQDAALERQIRAAVERDARLGRAVTLRGPVAHERLADEYAAADFFVLGSRREGSGYAAVEALACGVPPIVTDIAPFRWLTDGGTVGRLWRPGDSDSLCAALVDATNEPIEQQREACRRRFDGCFGWQAIGRRAVAIYEGLSRI
jgi:glycosyltransferase involved in cell wall biosynthesis